MSKAISRRDFLKRVGLASAGGLATAYGLPLSSVLAQDGLPFEVAADAVNPLGLEAGAAVEGVFFEGGYGRGFLDNAADWFRALHPDNPLSVEGIQQISEILRPRFIGGNPPDVMFNGGAFAIPIDSLVADEQLADLNDLMAAPALDAPGKTFGETLFPRFASRWRIRRASTLLEQSPSRSPASGTARPSWKRRAGIIRRPGMAIWASARRSRATVSRPGPIRANSRNTWSSAY